MRLHDFQQHPSYQITSSNIAEDNKQPFIRRPTYGVCYYTLDIVDCTLSNVK